MALPGPPFFFGERRTSPVKGLQARSDWRAPETGRDAALWRSAGAPGRGPGGKAPEIGGLGQWNVPLGRGHWACSVREPAWLRVGLLARTCAGSSLAGPENSGCQPSAPRPLPSRRNRWPSPGAVRVAGSILTTLFGKAQGPAQSTLQPLHSGSRESLDQTCFLAKRTAGRKPGLRLTFRSGLTGCARGLENASHPLVYAAMVPVTAPGCCLLPHLPTTARKCCEEFWTQPWKSVETLAGSWLEADL